MLSNAAKSFPSATLRHRSGRIALKPCSTANSRFPEEGVGIIDFASRKKWLSSSESEGANNGEVRTAQHAWERSCYFNIDFKIDENKSAFDAIRRMATYNVGCLIVTTNGKMTGIISERDYVCKIALFETSSKETKVKDICTRGVKMIMAKRSDSIDACVRKMIGADVRHLPVIDDRTKEVFGLISVKDIIREYTKTHDDIVRKMMDLSAKSSAP